MCPRMSIQDDGVAVRFANADIRTAVMRLFEYRCRVEACAKRSCAFRSLRELENHLWYTHWRQFCQTCLYGRPAFVCEQAAAAAPGQSQIARSTLPC